MKRILLASLLLAGCSATPTNSTTTTSEEQQQTTTIIAVGDISCSSSQRRSGDYDCADPQVAEIARQQNPDYLFALGDIQYNSHGTDDFAENFAIHWGDMINITKPVAGNHEYAMGGAKGYYDTWVNYPKPGYYSFDIDKKWHVIAINTNDKCRFVQCDKNSDQYNWVQTTLENNKTKCIIAIGHHPRYSSGVHGSTKEVDDMYRLFVENNVALYLSGHDHHYERIDAPVPQYVIGTGGKSLRKINSLKTKDPVLSEFSTSKHHGVGVVTITESNASVKFISIDGSVVDEKTHTCQR